MLFELLDRLAGTPRGVRTLSAGEALFRTGDPAASMFSVRAGLLRLSRCTPDGREVLMRRAGAGETLCEAALTADRYHCDAVAVKPSTVGVIAKTEVLERMRADVEFATALASSMAGEIRRVRALLELRNVKRARDRVLHYLLMMADERRVVPVADTVKDLASELGLTHESLYRELSGLVADGVIARERGAIRVLAAV